MSTLSGLQQNPHAFIFSNISAFRLPRSTELPPVSFEASALPARASPFCQQSLKLLPGPYQYAQSSHDRLSRKKSSTKYLCNTSFLALLTPKMCIFRQKKLDLLGQNL